MSTLTANAIEEHAIATGGSLEGAGRFAHVLHRIREAPTYQTRGRVVQLKGLVIESEGPPAAVGEVCRIESPRFQTSTLAEVVGFRGHNLLLMPLGEVQGLHPGAEVISLGGALTVPVSDAMKGRVIDALGVPLDALGPLPGSAGVQSLRDSRRPGRGRPPLPLARKRISEVFRTGVRALDAFVPCGRGQRLGIFAGSGVGKSTLLGMIARQAEADVNVIGLVGERGREVREFLEKDLGPAGLQKSVVVVATSDQPALVRLKGASLAVSIAEHFREEGQNVLLMMDSITRFATAQREVGLAVGEPPATRGFTPSVFSLLPQLLERAGTSDRGTITALCTVLVEADDMDDPIADAVRAILDGHVVLSRDLAMQNHYPAIDIMASVSRLERDLCSPSQLDMISKAREALAVYRRNQDLITIGAYPPGSNPQIDHAIRTQHELKGFLRQGVEEGSPLPESWQRLAMALEKSQREQPKP